MKAWITVILLLTGALCLAQTLKQPKAAAPPGNDYTGMYSFIREGEFVRINIEDGGRLTGFISRHGDDGKEIFVDHFFEKAEFHDRDVQFTAGKAHGVWFAFKGVISRGPGRTRDAEGYYEIKGTLVRYSSGANGKVAAEEREVTFHSLPQEICD
jgi:hypothetical protein